MTKISIDQLQNNDNFENLIKAHKGTWHNWKRTVVVISTEESNPTKKLYEFKEQNIFTRIIKFICGQELMNKKEIHKVITQIKSSPLPEHINPNYTSSEEKQTNKIFTPEQSKKFTIKTLRAVRASKEEFRSWLKDHHHKIQEYDLDGIAHTMAKYPKTNCELFSVLLEEHIPLNQIDKRDEFKNTPILWAVANANSPHINALLSLQDQGHDIGIDIADESSHNSTPLTLAISKGRRAKHKGDSIIEKLIEHSSNYEHADASGMTAMHWAALRHEVKWMEMLKEKGAIVDEKAQEMWNLPLEEANARFSSSIYPSKRKKQT